MLIKAKMNVHRDRERSGTQRSRDNIACEERQADRQTDALYKGRS